MRVMILWSGGVESTALLLHLLRDTEHEVFAHHIEMRNPEGRMHQERKAIAQLRPRLEQIRPFDFSTSYIEICGGKGFGMDFAIQYPIGLVAMRHLNCERLYRAGCLEDDWDHIRQRDDTYIHNRPDPTPGASHVRRAKALAPLLFAHESGEAIAPWLDSYVQPKAAHWAALGELADLTWSCRRPLAGNPCGKCHSCLEREEAKMGTSSIPEIREMLRET